MKNQLLTIANIFGWTANDIQLDEQLDYYKNILKDDSKAIANSRLFLRSYGTASSIMSYFVDILHAASPYLDADKPFVIINTETHMAYKNFESFARYWNHVKNRLDDDNAFLITFESTRYDYQLFDLI